MPWKPDVSLRVPDVGVDAVADAVKLADARRYGRVVAHLPRVRGRYRCGHGAVVHGLTDQSRTVVEVVDGKDRLRLAQMRLAIKLAKHARHRGTRPIMAVHDVGASVRG